LNSLPEVKRFLHEQAQFFERVEVQYVGGDPVAHFLDAEGATVESVPLAPFNMDEISALLKSKGFKHWEEQYHTEI
jgi:hypothetical protein